MAAPEVLEVMASRQRQAWLRPTIGAGIGLTFSPLLGLQNLLLWYGVVCLLHWLELRWTRSALRSVHVGKPINASIGLGLVFLINLAFSAVGVCAILSGETWTMVCGAVLLAGALLNAGASNGTSLPLFIAGSASAAAGCFSMVFVAHSSGASTGEQFGLVLAIGLLFLSLLFMRGIVVGALVAVKAASAAKGMFLANLSHEIRTPLNGILGVAQAMTADDLPPEQRERLEIIRRSGLALLSLLNDVLDLSKVEAGKFELDPGDVDLALLADDLARTFNATARQKGVIVRAAIAADAEGLWRCDAIRMRQVLTNLMSNAVKFTAKGEVVLTLAASPDGIVLAVSDTGIGIPPDKLDKVFDPYAQASRSTAGEYGGTGLGLAICRDLASLMGGHLVVESSTGVGSTFSLRLPLTRAAPAAEQASPKGDVSAGFAGLKVLAAEDHETNQTVLRLLLTQVGIDVHIVADGQAAVDAWRTNDWDVILMDVQMPGMDGPTATRLIRSEERTSSRVATPIIALTANAMKHQVEEYAVCGMDGHVCKPLEFERLLDAIASVLPWGAPTQGNIPLSA